MGQTLTLKAADGHSFPAYVAKPAGTPKGGIVVLQEIFGVNSHIRSVADGYAADGYFVVAPATFHRVKPGVSLSINCRQAKKNRASARLLQFPRQLLERDEPSGFGVPPLAVSSNFAGEGARPFRQQLLNSLRSQSSRALDRQLRLRCKHHEAASSCHCHCRCWCRPCGGSA